MLTKSLHTVTAVTKVALHVRNTVTVLDYRDNAAYLTDCALQILGYDSCELNDTRTDTTYAACVKAVVKAMQS